MNEKVIDEQVWVIPEINELHNYVGKPCKIFHYNSPCDEGVMWDVAEQTDYLHTARAWITGRHGWYVTQKTDAYYICFLIVPVDFSNKGRKKCVSCNCKTEMRRDFSDMTVREFCPRCRR